MSSVTEFGKELLRTGDLDPVYIAIHKAGLDEGTLHRLCLAYWCFYHLGLAAALAEIKQPKKFWEAMMKAAVNETSIDGTKPYPRGSERRHYRGAQAVSSMASLISLYPKGATQAVEGFIKPKAVSQYGLERKLVYTYSSVSRSVMQHRGFGEWIAFKIADMSERVLGYDTDFRDCFLGIYKDPRQGAAVAWLELNNDHHGHTKPWEFDISDSELKLTVDHYVKVFKKFNAPGGRVRPVNVQEVETIFCKYKSHLKGHYPMGKDTKEIRHGLHGWGHLAEQLSANLPK